MLDLLHGIRNYIFKASSIKKKDKYNLLTDTDEIINSLLAVRTNNGSWSSMAEPFKVRCTNE